MIQQTLLVDGREYSFTVKNVHVLYSKDLNRSLANTHLNIVSLNINGVEFKGTAIVDCLYKATEYIRKHNHFKDVRYE